MKKIRPIGEFGKIGSKQGPEAMPGSPPGVQSQKRVDDRKRQTVYLPAELAKWLKLHSVEVERDMSEIITELVQKYRTQVTDTSQRR
jgi:hypothetical protein